MHPALLDQLLAEQVKLDLGRPAPEGTVATQPFCCSLEVASEIRAIHRSCAGRTLAGLQDAFYGVGHGDIVWT